MLKRVRFFVSSVIFGLISFYDWVKCAVRVKMGTIIDNDDEEKKELDDSGCVQDDSTQQKMADDVVDSVNLLDLSDDVLLYILRHCSPRDLKALGFSCARLGRLVRERSLWRFVDARSEHCSVARLKWYVMNTLHSDTQQLYLQGYAAESRGCLGLLNCRRQDIEEDPKATKNSERDPSSTTQQPNVNRRRACLYISSHNSSRRPSFTRSSGTPLWSDDEKTIRPGNTRCSGPRFSVCEPLLKELGARCFRLSMLALERCNVNCKAINLGHLPSTLTKLSLRGSQCYNLPVDKSFLFKIHDHLPLLETLDVSECDWLDPSSLLPLSKHERLRELLMRDCHKLSEFVAYASLSSRYGFRNLQVLDLRGSPVGDSEVAPLAWLPELQELKLSAVMQVPPARHAHYADDATDTWRELDEWEMQDPAYLRYDDDSSDETVEFGDDDDRMDFDDDAKRSDDDDDDDEDDDDEDDDDDGDDNDGKRSRARKPNPGEHGESSKSKKDTTKRKAENGSGDASVNSNNSRTKRKRNEKNAASCSNNEGSKNCEEEEEFEMRRCETIVIVNRPYLDVNDDAEFRTFLRNWPRRGSRSNRNEERSGNEKRKTKKEGNKSTEEDKGDAKDDQEAHCSKHCPKTTSKAKESKPKDKSNENTKKGKAKNKKGDGKSKNTKSEKHNDEADDSKKTEERDKKDSGNSSNVKKTKVDKKDAKSEVNEGASTSKDTSMNEACNNNPNSDKNNDRPHRCKRHSNENNGDEEDELDPVIFSIGPARIEAVPSERIISFNRYSFRHERSHQPMFNIEVERRCMQAVQARLDVIERRRTEEEEADRALHPENYPPPPPVQPEEEEARHRRLFERARLMERNPQIMNLIRGIEPPPELNAPPLLLHDNAFFPLPQVFRNLRRLDENGEGRHRVLYVNVGQQANPFGPVPNVIQGMVSDRDGILNLSRSHLDPSSLVTDSAVRRFGRAAGNDIRFVLVGMPHPFMPTNEGTARPERSNLRVLVMNGYRNITDRSLVHLATAAPHLTLLDLRETNVTAQGVENFRSLRPECEVLFSPYVERNMDWLDEPDQ